MSEMPPSNPIELPKSFRVMEGASVVACIVLLGVLAYRVAVALTLESSVRGPLLSGLSLVGATVIGYLAADFSSGIVHFLADTFGSIDTPVLGKKFILPFRSHHDRPLEMTTHDFIETNGDSCFAALLVLIPVLATVPVEAGGAALFGAVCTLTGLTLIVFTNQFHKWAHAQNVPMPIRVLQSAGIILRPEQHAKHHAPPFAGRYCITSGVLNPVLDALGFFRILERAIRALLPRPRSIGRGSA